MTFEQFLRVAGLLPRDIVPDGRWRRCATVDKPKKRNGAYVLHPDGRGFCRNWAVDSELSSWREEGAHRAAPVDMAKLHAQRAAERAARLAAMRSARDFWARTHPMSELHPYLAAKGLSAQGCGALRVARDALVVPVWNGPWLVSLQSIREDGTKRFWPGAPVKGGAFVVDRPQAAVTAVCEGLATGLAVFQAVRQARVIVAFDAGNLQPVVERMRPTGSVVICADNDWQTAARIGTNPGVAKATNAAELIGCGVAYPEGIEGTDWCDYMKEAGAHAARRIERLILGSARYVRAREAPA